MYIKNSKTKRKNLKTICHRANYNNTKIRLIMFKKTESHVYFGLIERGGKESSERRRGYESCFIDRI